MTLGITGHQTLPEPAMWDWVETALSREIAGLPKPLVGVTSLAIGADQLFARLVLKHGGVLLHVKPFAEYERTFDVTGLSAYRELADNSDLEVLTMRGDDEDCFLAAGQRVADLCHLLFAVWNEQPSRGKGGTADIVDYAAGIRRRVVLLNPIACRVERR